MIDPVTFAERRAFLEVEAGLTSAEADRQALGELYEERMRIVPDGILGDLVLADRKRRDPTVTPLLEAMGLNHARVPWGVGYVVREGRTYRRPAVGEMGTAAFIVPAITDGAVDLVAEEIASGTITTRLDVASVVGFDWIEQARSTGTPLYVFNSVRRWLMGGGVGVVVVDWQRIAYELDGIAAILCSPEIAGRLKRSTARNFPRPFVATPNVKGAADAA